jgi:hypothetical protein
MNAHQGWSQAAAATRVPADLAAWMPPGTSLVITRDIQRALLLVPPIIEQGRIGLIDGPAGSGKSQLLGAVEAACPHRVVRITAEGGDRSRALDAMIHEKLTGHVATGTERSIERANSVELGRAPTLLIVDEAQLVSTSALLSFRRIMRDAARPFGLLFAGIGMARHAKRDPSLLSRGSFTITLERMSGQQLLATLAAAHPLLAAAPHDVLLDADRVLCRGQWRTWMLLLEQHQNLHGTGTAVTRDSLALVLDAAHGLVLPATATARRRSAS